jgi:hypothetical protein
MGALTRTFLRAVLMPVLLSITLFSTSSAQQRALKVDELAKRAEVVAVGRVTELKSEWNQDQTMIFTRVTLAVDEYIKGGDRTSSLVTITTLGGEVGEVGEMYTHAPSFRQNERVVVFLQKDQRGEYRVSGGTQGKYNIEKDPVTGQMVVAGEQRLEEFTEAVKQDLRK